MRLIVDANILFSALIKDSSTAKILVDDRLKFYAPEFLFEEFAI
jgi:predicted nucleic acid-binding protein